MLVTLLNGMHEANILGYLVTPGRSHFIMHMHIHLASIDTIALDEGSEHMMGGSENKKRGLKDGIISNNGIYDTDDEARFTESRSR